MFMDNENFRLIISPVASIIGVIVGFLLSFWLKRYDENRTKREERQSVRTLIRLEIQQNIDELKIFWNGFKEIEKKIADPKQQIRNKVIKLSESPIPSWSYKAWESQLSKLPVVFKSEEIVHIQSNYKRLNQISNLIDLLPNRKIAVGNTVLTSHMAGDVMMIYNDENESRFWKNFEDLILCAIETGNPIEEKTVDLNIMQTSTPFMGFQISELTAINIAKSITIVCLIALASIYGIHDVRQVLYLCLHISYCCWWLLEQWFFPQRRQQIFTDKIGLFPFVSLLLFVGIFYALPGYFAFTNSQPIAYVTIAISLPLYIFGSLINTAADIQKMTAKGMGAGLVSDGIWRSIRHINYLGDLMRYTSFSIVAGSGWAFLLPGLISLLYLQRIATKETAMAANYPEFTDYQQQSSRLFPFIW
jgi:protein-S-isoprenylcysteine O-methyltransferase Ste14